MTTAERLRLEGEQIGLTKGEQIGLAKGRVQSIVVLLRARGIEVGPEVVQRLSSLTVDELDRLVPRAATVHRADDLFGAH